MIMEKLLKYKHLAIVTLIISILKISTFFPETYLLANFLTQRKLTSIQQAISLHLGKSKQGQKQLQSILESQPLALSAFDHWGQRLNIRFLDEKKFIIQNT